MALELSRSSSFSTSKLEIDWKNLSVVEQKKNEEPKFILDNVSGALKPGTFTSILGPSGSGKTTLMNILSGRFFANNLKIYGEININGNKIDDLSPLLNYVSFIMQDDILHDCLTPREILSFIADLKIKGDAKLKKERVDGIIGELGLSKAADTIVGSESRKGISGGEKKRTSIATELILDPDLIFLDEPTTGLDSTTALSVIQMLDTLVQRGKTVCAIVHQPSSQIFRKFDDIILICRGHIIFQGKAEESLSYFSFLPSMEKLSTEYNPADFFLRIMNPEGMIMEDERLAKKENAEELSALFSSQFSRLVGMYNKKIRPGFEDDGKEKKEMGIKEVYMSSLATQFSIIFRRTFVLSFKNPMAFAIRSLQYIVLSLILLSVFYNLGDGVQAIQNTRGVMFFIASTNCMLSFSGNLEIFLHEKFIFFREKFSKFYTLGPYFMGRTMAELPFHIFYPSLSMILIYYAIGFNDSESYKLPIFILTSNITFFAGVSFSYMISVAAPNLEAAGLMVPILFIPFMIFSGFFVNQNDLPYVFYPFVYLSIFKYAYQANLINQFEDLDPPIQCNPSCDPLAEQGFKEGLWTCLIVLFAIGILLRFLAFILLKKKTDWAVKCAILPSIAAPPSTFKAEE